MTRRLQQGDTVDAAVVRPRMPELVSIALNRIERAGLPKPTHAEYRFAAPRRFAFDFAWEPDGRRVALELEGGVYRKGGGWHQSIQRYTSDAEKYSEASIRGWKVIRVVRAQVEDGTMVALLRRALGL